METDFRVKSVETFTNKKIGSNRVAGASKSNVFDQFCLVFFPARNRVWEFFSVEDKYWNLKVENGGNTMFLLLIFFAFLTFERPQTS